MTDRDEMFAYAVIHALEIIGEAARHVSNEVQARSPQLELLLSGLPD